MRKVYIDISMIMIGTKFTGIPRVVMELVKRIAKADDLELVFVEYNLSKDAFEIIDKDKFIEFCNHGKDQRSKMRTGRILAFEEIEKDSVFFDIDTVWKTRVRRSFLYPILKKNGVKIITHIYDIIPVSHPQFCAKDEILNFVDYFGATLDYADEIVVNSKATKDAIDDVCQTINHESKEIKVVPLGGDFTKKIYDENSVSDEVKKIVANGKYVLMVGTIEPRKNHRLILDAYDLGLDEGMQVVFAGFIGQGMDELTKRIENYKENNEKVWHLGNASDADIDYLYRHCFALTYPSYIEGFGLPIIESFARGVMVIAADTSINMEIGGERAVYFKQDAAEELKDTINNLLKETDKQADFKKLIEGYEPPKWDDTALRMAEILKDK